MECRYTYRVEWSADHGQYVARCLELDGLDAAARTAPDALARAEMRVNDHLRDLESMGDPLPAPLSERNFSGNFMIRTSRALHARMATEAVEQGVSLNQWVVQKLADRKPSLDW